LLCSREIRVNATTVYYGNFEYAILLDSYKLIREWMVDNNTYYNNTVSTWTSGEGVNNILSLTSDSNYIYAGGNVAPGKVSKIDKSTMLTVSTWTSGEGVNYIRSLTSDSNYIYAGGYVTPGKVSKIKFSLIFFYEIWDGAVKVYGASVIEPDINDFIEPPTQIETTETTTFTFSQWMILLFIALGISLLAAIKFHIIATVSLFLVLYMIINVASYTSMILLAIIIWLLTIMFSIVAFGEI